MKGKIPWNHSLNILLLQCIQQKGAHIPKYGKTNDTWNAVNEMFFDEDSTSSIKESCYEKGNIRKMRDHYDSLRKEIEKIPAWIAFKGKGGNVSAMD
eukprot:gene19156-38377_t